MLVDGVFTDRRVFITRKSTKLVSGVASKDVNAEPIYLTATTVVTYEESSEVTSNPVTSGNDRADHVTIKTPTVLITGVVSDTPLVFSNKPARDRKSYVSMIRDINKRKDLVDVRMDRIGDVIPDCIITSVRFTSDKDIGGGVRVEMRLKKLLVSPSANIVEVAPQQKEETSPEEQKDNAPTNKVELPKRVQATTGVNNLIGATPEVVSFYNTAAGLF